MTAFTRRVILLVTMLFGATAPAHAAATVEATEIERIGATLDTMWMLVAATLVFMMQIGFMMLEAGSVRTKNAISVAQKNMLDFAFATLAFALVGFGIAFSPATTALPIGSDSSWFLLQGLSGEHAAFFVFQVMFCGTAATIVSGAVAERMRLRAYIILCLMMATVIYPIFAHWAWGTALGASAGAFLANGGFVDFAGSTVVHATGGWFALAACIMLGARRGRFTEGAPMRIGGHSAVLASAGALMLFVGWIGFNGGSTLKASAEVPGIILNTVLAGAAGAAVGYGQMWFRGAMLPERAVNGLVAGLVAITAGCHLVSPGGAILLGAVGALFANIANHILETRFRIDDAVGAVGVHGVAGVIGTLGLALVAPAEALPAGSHMGQLIIQAEASALNFVWAFGFGLAVIFAIKPLIELRVSAEEEEAGLNAAEHGVGMGTDRLQAALQHLMHGESAAPGRLAVDPGDDNELISMTLNNLMDKLQEEEEARFQQAEATRNADEAQRLVAFGEVASDCIFLIHRGKIRSANAAAAALFETDIDSMIGGDPRMLVRQDFREQMGAWLDDDDAALQRAYVTSGRDREAPVELRFRRIELNGLQVTVLRMTDLTERMEAQRRIYHLALHDTLTDLPNRELFNRRLAEALADRKSQALTALLLIDVDRFKDINDLHGHPAGDMLLVAVAERLRSGVRECDTVARLGGDEFAIIQTRIAFPAQAQDLAHRVLLNISEPLTLPNGVTIQPKVSIGLALCPGDGDTPEALIQNADQALYSAKKSGRHRFHQYEPQMGRMLRLRQELEDDLAHAIDRDELELHYQPRVDLATGQLASYEALLRWQRSDRLVPPDDFIAIAEESGLIMPLGSWVIAEACRTAAGELAGTSVSVNLSPRQFQDPDLIAKIAAALDESGLPPEKLEIEITESALIEDDMLASQIIADLRRLGVRVALDDFGTGYSSLSHLTRFSFDTIKIDRSFVQATDEKTWQVVRSVLRMSTEMDVCVVAEGVETIEQLERLANEGCDEVQGYLISAPIPVHAVLEALPKGLFGLSNLVAART